MRTLTHTTPRRRTMAAPCPACDVFALVHVDGQDITSRKDFDETAIQASLLSLVQVALHDGLGTRRQHDHDQVCDERSLGIPPKELSCRPLTDSPDVQV
ncbi:hypothetical protein [Streptomyces sp. NPDC001508]|uniref:hypothetical protein n=1 Tax=Streptomyces sp. NPDC001508 TaxID=3154656 RepID=UPI00333202AF